MAYAVCTSCPFLRAYSSSAAGDARPGPCPACGAQLEIRNDEGRFHSAYVGKVSLELMATPELGTTPGDPDQNGQPTPPVT